MLQDELELKREFHQTFINLQYLVACTWIAMTDDVVAHTITNDEDPDTRAGMQIVRSLCLVGEIRPRETKPQVSQVNKASASSLEV